MAEKILGIHDLSWQFVGHDLTPVMLADIESGAIYSYTLTMPLAHSLPAVGLGTSYWTRSSSPYSAAEVMLWPCTVSRVSFNRSKGYSDPASLHLR